MNRLSVAQVIENLGGPRAVQGMTDLSPGRISQWKTENRIPKAWLKFLRQARPDAFVNGKKKRRIRR